MTSRRWIRQIKRIFSSPWLVSVTLTVTSSVSGEVSSLPGELALPWLPSEDGELTVKDLGRPLATNCEILMDGRLTVGEPPLTVARRCLASNWRKAGPTADVPWKTSSLSRSLSVSFSRGLHEKQTNKVVTLRVSLHANFSSSGSSLVGDQRSGECTSEQVSTGKQRARGKAAGFRWVRDKLWTSHC